MKHVPLLLVLCLAGAANSADDNLRAVLEQLGVDPVAGSVQPAPIPGFVEVTRGMQVLYVADDGSLVIDGDILSVRTETNLTEKRRAAVRLGLLETVPDDRSLVLPAQAPTVARIVVFTDTECPYCSRLHQRHAELQARGVEIRYLFYPRSGPASASFDQAVAVWCSRDRLAALDRSLRGDELPAATCEHPVLEHYALARELELKGTPAVIAGDGRIRYGLHLPDEILAFTEDAALP